MQERVVTAAAAERQNRPFREPSLVVFFDRIRHLLYSALSPVVEGIADLGKPGVRRQSSQKTLPQGLPSQIR